jgi:putative transposase
VLKDVPLGKSKDFAAMLKAVHAQEDIDAPREKDHAVTEKLCSMRLAAAAKCFEHGVEETLSYMAFPREHWTRIRSNNMLERIVKEIRRRTHIVGAFSDGKSALMLVAARLRHLSGTKWGTRRYLDINRLHQH